MPPKGKPPTKGSRQIMRENEQTAKFYLVLIVGTSLIRPLLSLAYNWLTLSELVVGSILSNGVIPVILLLLIYIMKMLFLLYSTDQKLLGFAYDVNMIGGWGEHLKDAIILLAFTHIISVVSPFFWYIPLLMPLRILYICWKYIIQPWLIYTMNNGGYQDKKFGKKMKKKRGKKKLKYHRTITHWHHFR